MIRLVLQTLSCVTVLSLSVICRGQSASNADRAAWLREHVSANEKVALSNAGLNAYVLPLETHVLDMVGLTDRHIARLPPRFPSGLLGRGDGFGKWDIDYVLAAQPDIVEAVVGSRGPNGAFDSPYTGTRLLLRDPRFVARYEPARGAPKGLFVRRAE